MKNLHYFYATGFYDNGDSYFESGYDDNYEAYFTAVDKCIKDIRVYKVLNDGTEKQVV